MRLSQYAQPRSTGQRKPWDVSLQGTGGKLIIPFPPPRRVLAHCSSLVANWTEKERATAHVEGTPTPHILPEVSHTQLGSPQLGWRTDFAEHYVMTAQVLGAGEFGTVYLARQIGSGHEVAVKVIKKSREGRTAGQHLECIAQECEVWKRCQACPHVVRLEGLFEDADQVYLVQELCKGGDLRSILKRGPLSEPETAQVMAAVLDVINECHSHHYSFGDVKPANFLLKLPHQAVQCQLYPDTQSSTPAPLDCEIPPPTPPPTPGIALMKDATSRSSKQPSSLNMAGGGPPSAFELEALQNHILPFPDMGIQAQGGKEGARGDGNRTREGVPDGEGGEGGGGGMHGAMVMAFHVGAKSQDLQGAISPSTSFPSSPGSSSSLIPPDPLSLSPPHTPTQPSSASSPPPPSILLPFPPLHENDDHHHGPPAHSRRRSHHSHTPRHSSHTPSKRFSSSLSPSTTSRSSIKGAPACCHPELMVMAVDFGCAQMLQSRSRCAAAVVKRMGSPVYMAPEQWQGSGLGLAIDIWGAGVMMYMLLSGRYPFWSMGPQEVDKMALHQVVCAIQSNPILLGGGEEPWGNISRPCKDLLIEMLDRQPSTRITAQAALSHPWFRQQLGRSPRATTKAPLSAETDLWAENMEHN